MPNPIAPNQEIGLPKAATVRLIPMMAEGAVATPESRFGARVSYARKELDLNIEALSRLTKEYDPNRQGVSPTTISRYESGSNLPGLAEFRILCEALDVTAQWLLYGNLDNAGKNEFEQEFLASLDRLIRSKAEDPIIGGVPISTHVASYAISSREAALARAKAPKAD